MRILYTQGDGKFIEDTWDKPEPLDNEIEVKAIMTGVCRSDIDMMNGKFQTLPVHMSGHEGLGEVTKVGKLVDGVEVGDYVATRGEPAYSDYYNVRNHEFVIVPEAAPKYMLEPVACGVNVIMQPQDAIARRTGDDKRCLILGSGFLAQVVYKTLTHNGFNFKDIVVCGRANKDIWGDLLVQEYEGTFDVIIDLSNKDDVFNKPIVNEEALVIMGVEKEITTNFSNLLWKACTIVFPSPRTNMFYNAMCVAKAMVEEGILDVGSFWTRGYDRNTEWRQAFEDGNNRPEGYSRGYIIW
jgi:D-arabinose 1-dehydrogenase-like Zn-dependent alcohol dehydrogenase